MKIHKYRVPSIGLSSIVMHSGSKILHVGNQHEEIYVWVMEDEMRPKYHRPFMVLPTGGHVNSCTPCHVGTVVYSPKMGGGLVWHVFSEKEER